MEDINNFEYVNVKAKVPKVIDIVIPGTQGLPGEQGLKGDKGDPFRYEDFTPEQLEALKGPKGDKGEDGRDGASATAEKSAEFFKRKNFYLENADVDTVLYKLLEIMDSAIVEEEYAPLTYIQPLKGQTTLAVQGQPHFKVSVNGGDKHVFESKGLELPIAAFGEDDITLKYYDLMDREVSTVTVSGVTDNNDGTPDDTYEKAGAKYALYGKRLIVNVSNYIESEDNPFVFMGKWTSDKVDNITINTNKQKTLHIGSGSDLNLGDKPIYVSTPERIYLSILIYAVNHRVNIGTLQQGTTLTLFNNSQYSWSSSKHRYVATGDNFDAL